MAERGPLQLICIIHLESDMHILHVVQQSRKQAEALGTAFKCSICATSASCQYCGLMEVVYAFCHWSAKLKGRLVVVDDLR